MCGNIYSLMLVNALIEEGVTVQEWYYASNPPKEDGICDKCGHELSLLDMIPFIRLISVS